MVNQAFAVIEAIVVALNYCEGFDATELWLGDGVSLQRWETDDTLILIDWAANESAAAIKAGQHLDATKLLQDVATVIGGFSFTAATTDSRLEKWLDFRTSEVSYPLRDYKRNGSEIDPVQRQRILTSLDLLAKYYKNYESGVHTLGEEVVLPEPFDEKSVFW